MIHTLAELARAYLWVAAIGFPICLPWALLKARDMRANYRTGWDDGYGEAYEHWELRARGLFERIKHGDNEHQRWLRRELNHYFELTSSAHGARDA
jgi:4-amino-4-deoxy-L-arabinose transferase-like glycosyltransferase